MMAQTSKWCLHTTHYFKNFQKSYIQTITLVRNCLFVWCFVWKILLLSLLMYLLLIINQGMNNTVFFIFCINFIHILLVLLPSDIMIFTFSWSNDRQKIHRGFSWNGARISLSSIIRRANRSQNTVFYGVFERDWSCRSWNYRGNCANT